MSNIFNSSCFVGYVNAVQAQYLTIHFPSAQLLRRFRWNGDSYAGAEVNKYILIESDTHGFLARIVELHLPDSERKELNESAVQRSDSDFHPAGRAELLLSFDIRDPLTVSSSIAHYPGIGAKVYSCSEDLISEYVSKAGNEKNDNLPFLNLAEVLASNVECKVSANALLNRHCAILGTTGGGKSWTLARIIEEFAQIISAKLVLIDPTGEYKPLDRLSWVKSIQFGIDVFLSPSKLSNSEFCFIFKESSPNTMASLCNALDSLRIIEMSQGEYDGKKQGKRIADIENILYKYYPRIHEASLNINNLAEQLRNECVKENRGCYEPDPFKQAYCSHLISRVNLLLNTPCYKTVFGLDPSGNPVDVFSAIDAFLRDDERSAPSVLRIDFSGISFDFSMREVVVDLLSSHLLSQARKGLFNCEPLVLCVDEAHQFLNKSSISDNGERLFMNGVSNIAKEGRKYGLFLCLATQMPRDIPIDILSQMGAFVVHRLTNEADKKAVDAACSFASKSVLAYMPVLGAGEAVLCGAEFPMPMLLKIIPPCNKPNSMTPQLRLKR